MKWSCPLATKAPRNTANTVCGRERLLGAILHNLLTLPLSFLPLPCDSPCPRKLEVRCHLAPNNQTQYDLDLVSGASLSWAGT